MTASRFLHFSLLQIPDRLSGEPHGLSSESLFLKVGGHTFELNAHDDASLQGMARKNSALAPFVRQNGHGFSHFAEIPERCFGRHNVTFMQVVGEKNGRFNSSLPNVYHMSFHIPDRHIRRYARRFSALQVARNLRGAMLPGKLSALGMDLDRLNHLGLDSSDLLVDANDMKTPWDIACSVLYLHPEMASSRAYDAAIMMNEHIAPPKALNPEQYNRVYELALAISKQGPATENKGFATYGQVAAPDGSKMYYEFDWKDKNGDVIFKEGDPVMQYALSDITADGSAPAAAHALRSARNDADLQNRRWSVSQSQSLDIEEVMVSEGPTKKTRKVSAGAKNWTAVNKSGDHGLKVYSDSIQYRESDSQFSVDFKNTYLRQLGVFIEFFEDMQMKKPISGPKVNGNWPFYFPEFLAKAFETDSKKALGTLSNVNNIMGIPMPTDSTHFSTPWPEEAQAARFLFGGLGTSNWQNPIVWPGVLLTGIFQYAVPIVCMIGGAMITDAQWYKRFMRDKDNVIALAAVAAPLIIVDIATESALGNTKAVLTRYARMAVGILGKKGLEFIALYVGEKLLMAEMLAAIPWVGPAYRIAATTMDVAQMAVTTGELLSSPATLEVEIKRQMTLEFTLKPDPAHGEAGNPETAIWPPVGSKCEVIVEYNNGTYYVQSQSLPQTTSSAPLVFTFNDIGWGGQLRIKANVYSATGWLAGAYASELMDAKPDSASAGVMTHSARIKEMLVPLTQATQYQYKQQLAFDSDAKKHTWVTGTVPTQTRSAANCSNVGPNLCKLVGMTIINSDYQVGYCYQASNQNVPLEDPGSAANSGQMYVLQNISILSDGTGGGVDSLNTRLKQSEVGFKVQALIAYDTFGEGKDKNSISSNNFIIDSRFGKYYLRQVDLRDGKHDFGLAHADKSWGVFTIPHLDAMIVHPSGYVVAVSWEYSKMQILKLGESAVDDADAPEAQIVSGQGILQGLTHGPIALAVAPDGRILLLETQNARVQAFDVKGNPVPSFSGRTLFGLDAAEYSADLDAERFSDPLQQAFRDHGQSYLFTVDEAEFIPALDRGELTETIVSAFAEEGIYLCYQQTGEGVIDTSAGSTENATVTVITPGTEWRIDDPQMRAVYILLAAETGIDVHDELKEVQVKALAPGKKWQVSDVPGARSWWLTRVANRIDVIECLSYFHLHEPQGVTYLDLAMEAKGYIYVLSYRGSGLSASDYVLDIYEPDGSFLVTSPDPDLIRDPGARQYLAAARLVVDPFRTLVSLNYGAFAGTNGRTEPIVSQWTPNTPLFDLDISNLAYFQHGDMTTIRSLFKKHGCELGADARLKTLNPAGYFTVEDTTLFYPVIATLDSQGRQIISVYGFSV
ncbi:MAG: hypothetical protein LBV45_00610 [Xanthomonadaceae bacterium]|jgi:hypothetical protein|nr:hypothetical protein [Xanthomonadaceae bacterium]